MTSGKPYVFDTSAFIDLFKHYPADIFPSLMKKFLALVGEGRIVSVKAVYDEIIFKKEELPEDPLIAWTETHGTLFSCPSASEQMDVKKISKEHPKLVPTRKAMEKRGTADPYVIARARQISGYVVTEDGYKNIITQKTLKSKGLAFVCKEMKTLCLNLTEFMQSQGWRF